MYYITENLPYEGDKETIDTIVNSLALKIKREFPHHEIGEATKITIDQYPNHEQFQVWKINAIYFGDVAYCSMEIHKKIEEMMFKNL